MKRTTGTRCDAMQASPSRRAAGPNRHKRARTPESRDKDEVSIHICGWWRACDRYLKLRWLFCRLSFQLKQFCWHHSWLFQLPWKCHFSFSGAKESVLWHRRRCSRHCLWHATLMIWKLCSSSAHRRCVLGASRFPGQLPWEMHGTRSIDENAILLLRKMKILFHSVDAVSWHSDIANWNAPEHYPDHGC